MAKVATHRRGASPAGCTRPLQAAQEPAIEDQVSTAVDLDGRNQRRKSWRRLDGTMIGNAKEELLFRASPEQCSSPRVLALSEVF